MSSFLFIMVMEALSCMLEKDRSVGARSRLKNINITLLAKWERRFKSDKSKSWSKVIGAIHMTKTSWDFFPD
ncbi:hypothetical protein HanIR_Chr12g0568611 [Helianthus annuus]|nr:hypothetical protein HanIR_Chr12g0568611 [Helianthus annuus]